MLGGFPHVGLSSSRWSPQIAWEEDRSPGALQVGELVGRLIGRLVGWFGLVQRGTYFSKKLANLRKRQKEEEVTRGLLLVETMVSCKFLCILTSLHEVWSGSWKEFCVDAMTPGAPDPLWRSRSRLTRHAKTWMTWIQTFQLWSEGLVLRW